MLAAAIVLLGSLGLSSGATQHLDLGEAEAGEAASLPVGAQDALSAAQGSLSPIAERGSAPLAENAAIQQAQLSAVEELVPLLEGADELDGHARVQRALEVASTSLEHRSQTVGVERWASSAALLEQEAASLEAAGALSAVREAGEGGLAEALAHVAVVSQRQADGLGIPAPQEANAPTPPAFEAPSEAVQALADSQGAPAGDPARLEALDELREPVRSALTGTIAAFLAFDASLAQGLEGAGPPGLDAREIAMAGQRVPSEVASIQDDEGKGLISPSERARALELDPSIALAARTQLLERMASLQLTLEGNDAADSDLEPVRVPGVFALDLSGAASTYTEDYALLVDVGGDDTYRNNAGGSNLGGGACGLEERAGAAALLDLAGNDTYGDVDERRSCGVNGGAYTGAGLLVDVGGEDRFHAGGAGANGGAIAEGLGLLVAVGGSDVFDAYSFGTNGGGNEALGSLVSVGGSDAYLGGSLGSNGAATGSGIGVLVDTDGSDAYTGGIIGANGAGDGYLLGTGIGALVDLGQEDDTYRSSGGNGGGSRKGVGFLLDGGGEDRFFSHSFGTNGGGHAQGVGMLVSAGGSDTFLADYSGANGGATGQGVGFLVNLGMGSTYAINHEESTVKPGTQGFNGGSSRGGLALLVDGGASRFEASSWGVNGGTHGDGASLLVTGPGDDVLEADSLGANGGAVGGSALVVDRGGHDRYQAEDGGTNGGGDDGGAGAIVDLAGDDTYLGDGGGSNGGASGGGLGLIVDETGDDVYRAGSGGANGHAQPLSYALLLDLGGQDRYEDGEGGTGWDRTVVPKGALGAQIDAEGSP